MIIYYRSHPLRLNLKNPLILLGWVSHPPIEMSWELIDPTAWSSKTHQWSSLRQILWLVGPPSAKNNRASWWFFPTHLKNMLVKLDHFPRDRDENQKYLKPPPSRVILGKERTKVCYVNLVWFFLVEDGYEAKPAFFVGNTRDRLQSCSLHRNEFGPWQMYVCKSYDSECFPWRF